MKIIFALVLVAVAAVYVDALKCYQCENCAEVSDDTPSQTCRAGAHCLEKKVEKDGQVTIERRCCGRECPTDETTKACKTCKTDLCNKSPL